MSNRCLRPLAALMSVICLAISGMAQMNSNAGVIKGELRCDDATLFNGYRVECTVSDSRGDTLRADVQLDGIFHLCSDIRPGSYMLNVITVAGAMVHQRIRGGVAAVGCALRAYSRA